ncbi:MAG: HAMP domain-containing sensor histidine kinase, partial [Bacteroidota bacterium]
TCILEGMKDWLEMIELGEIKKESVNLREVLELLKKNSLYKGEVIVKDLPVLEISRGQFISLFDNLIKNGLHYNDKANPWVKVYADGGAILVEDNGNGFPVETFEMLCKPFQRLDTDKTGSGLGLAIVKGICDNHGFVFSAESTAGKGSRFRIQYA